MIINRTETLGISTMFVPGMGAVAGSSEEGPEKTRTNGIQNLVEYYQNLFDKEESNNYGPDMYQDAKRKFVKYLLNTRTIV